MCVFWAAGSISPAASFSGRSSVLSGCCLDFVGQVSQRSSFFGWAPFSRRPLVRVSWPGLEAGGFRGRAFGLARREVRRRLRDYLDCRGGIGLVLADAAFGDAGAWCASRWLWMVWSCRQALGAAWSRWARPNLEQRGGSPRYSYPGVTSDRPKRDEFTFQRAR